MPDLSSVAREAAEREYPLPDDLSTTSHSLRLVAREHFANGFTECASRLPSEEEICLAILGRTATAGAKAVLAMIREKISR